MLNVVIACPLTMKLSGDNSDVQDLGVGKSEVSLSRGQSFAHGTGANQCNAFFSDKRGITSAGETLDLNDTVLEDSFGVGLALTKLKYLWIKNLTDSDMTIGNAAATQLGLFTAGTHSMVIKPGGQFLWTAPDANGLDCSTNDSLKIVHAGSGTQDYEIVIAGVR